MRRNGVGYYRSLHESAHPHQVVHGRDDGERPPDSLHTPKFDLAQQSHRFQPAKDLFDPFALLLTHSIAGVPAINLIGSVCRKLDHLGRDLQGP